MYIWLCSIGLHNCWVRGSFLTVQSLQKKWVYSARISVVIIVRTATQLFLFFFYFQPANDLHVQEQDESEIFSQEVHKITTVRQYFGWKFSFKTEFRNGFVIVMIVTSVILIPWENLVMLKRWICWFFKILLSSNKYFMVPLNYVILWLE